LNNEIIIKFKYKKEKRKITENIYVKLEFFEINNKFITTVLFVIEFVEVLTFI